MCGFVQTLVTVSLLMKAAALAAQLRLATPSHRRSTTSIGSISHPYSECARGPMHNPWLRFALESRFRTRRTRRQFPLWLRRGLPADCGDACSPLRYAADVGRRNPGTLRAAARSHASTL